MLCFVYTSLTETSVFSARACQATSDVNFLKAKPAGKLFSYSRQIEQTIVSAQFL